MIYEQQQEQQQQQKQQLSLLPPLHLQNFLDRIILESSMITSIKREILFTSNNNNTITVLLLLLLLLTSSTSVCHCSVFLSYYCIWYYYSINRIYNNIIGNATYEGFDWGNTAAAAYNLILLIFRPYILQMILEVDNNTIITIP